MATRRSPLRCVFRVAAGPRIGFGHLMRARALARALGVKPRVSVRGGPAAKRTAAQLGFTVLSSGSGALANVELLVVDEPGTDERRSWLHRARQRAIATVAVVDIGPSPKGADLVVHSHPTSSRIGTRTRVLAGSSFYILDPRAAAGRARRRRPGRGRAYRVLVALGGGAHVRAQAGALVEAVRRRCPDAVVRVAAGFASATRPRARLRGGAWIEAPRGLVGPLSACDVAVVAGGVTLHEACALGVPVVCLAVAPLQRRAISAFAARGAVIDAGAPQAANSADRVALGVEALLRNKSLRDRISRRARTLVDGRGAIRVARQIRLLARADRGIARG